jgi:hypothetical protein
MRRRHNVIVVLTLIAGVVIWIAIASARRSKLSACLERELPRLARTSTAVFRLHSRAIGLTKEDVAGLKEALQASDALAIQDQGFFGLAVEFHFDDGSEIIWPVVIEDRQYALVVCRWRLGSQELNDLLYSFHVRLTAEHRRDEQ